METLSEEFKPVALENYGFWYKPKMKVKWALLHFRTIKIAMEATQSEILLSEKHLEYIKVNSDFDTRIKICNSREGRV